MIKPVKASRNNRQTSTSPLTGKRPSEAAGLGRTTGLRSLFMASSNKARRLSQLIRNIRDYNPDAAKALSNMLRLVNSGFTITAVQEDGETPVPAGQEILDRLVRPFPPMIAKEYGGGASVLIDMAILTLFTQGALAIEIELKELTDPDPIEDMIVLDPWVIDWEKDERGRWMPGVRSLGTFTPLHPIQFRYFPADPEPNDPRGRSAFLAALDIIFFQTEVLRDLKQAVHFAGYPRVDISVVYDAVFNAIKTTRPDLAKPGQEANLQAELQGYLNDIAELVDDLEPDDAFIHYDNVTPKYIIPTGRSVDLSQLMATIDTQVIAALKQLPVLMGRNVGASETHATVQWQVFSEELAHIQRTLAGAFEWAFTLALRAYGIQAQAKLEFKIVRSINQKAELESEKLATETARLQVLYGWITNDEAAQQVVGHDAVAEPAPPPPQSNTSGDEDEDEDQDAPTDEDLEDEDGDRRALFARLATTPNLDWQIERAEEAQRLLSNVAELPAWQRALYQSTEDSVADLMRTQGEVIFDNLQALSESRDVSMETAPRNGRSHNGKTER